jgi:hypothetical protein
MKPLKMCERHWHGLRMLFLAFGATLVLLGTARTLSAARDPLVRVEEPPSPLPEHSWQQVRGEQMSFREGLRLWGMTVEAKAGGEASIKDTPDILKVEMKWESSDEIGLTVAIKLPEVVKGYEFEGEYKFKVSPEAVTHSENFALAFDGAKVSGEIKSASDEGLGYEVAGEFKRNLLMLKTALGNKGSSYEIAVELGKVKIKLDPVKYGQRFVTFAPRFVDFAKGPAGDAVNAVQVQMNPGLIAAAIANNVNMWIEQVRIQNTAAKSSNDDVLDTLPFEAVQSRRSVQADWTDQESWQRWLEEEVSRAEDVRRHEKAKDDFKRELLSQAGAFGYLTAGAGMACENPDALRAEVRKGNYSKVGMERQYLTIYLSTVSPGKGVSPCQYEILNKINNSDAPISWQQLQAWGSQYRAAHPSILQRAEKTLAAFRESFRHFVSFGDGPASSDRNPRSSHDGGTDHSRHAPDVMGGRAATQLRGIGSGGWN